MGLHSAQPGRVSRRDFMTGAAALGLAATAGSRLSGAPAVAAAPTGTATSTAAPGSTRGVGFALSHEQFPAPTLVALGRAAEAAGFNTVWTSDHTQPWMANEGHAGHAWVTLSSLGAQTGQIPFGTGVTCPTFRHHPAIVAQAFATLGQFYPGHVFLGVGSGEALNEKATTGVWPKWQERSDRLVEAIQLIRQLWTGEVVNFQGKYFQTTALRLWDLPAQPVPLYVASNGLKSMYRAGQYGDGLITDTQSLMSVPRMINFRQGALAAGKDPAAMPILVEHFVVVGGKAEAEEAASYWRFIPRSWQTYVNEPDPRVINNRADVETSLEEVYASWPVSTDPAVHIAALQKLFDNGATQVYVHSGQFDQYGVIDFYGRYVLPQLRASGVLGAQLG